MKDTLKLWKCNGVRPTTQSCNNSIVCNKDDERLEKFGSKKSGIKRFYTCDECLDKFNKRMDQIERNIFVEIFNK
jgi:hypothetical protein